MVESEFIWKIFISSVSDFSVSVMLSLPNQNYLVLWKVFCKGDKLLEVMQSLTFKTQESDGKYKMDGIISER